MASSDGRAASRPVVVAGMHRSGTSLLASWLAALGVDMGPRLLAADVSNPRGYFEDEDVRELQGRMLLASTPGGEGGHRDWGWTEGERFDERNLAAFRGEAAALIAARSGHQGLWGWKDPRTTLTLEFWDELMLAATPALAPPCYVLVYRFPWEVAESMQRLGAEVFLENPEYAYRIWAFYNRRLLAFRRCLRARTLLVSANALLREPERLPALLREKLGLVVGAASLSRWREETLFVSVAGNDPLIGLVAATSPDCIRLLADLDAEADLPATGRWQVPVPDGTASTATPRLSIVIPCRDHGQFLIEAIASVERTVDVPYELIIVNDGSRQARTLEILAVLRRARYDVRDQAPTGLAAARNHGIRCARGDYVLPLDADNRLRLGFAEAAVRILDAEPEVGVVYGDRCEFGWRTGRVQVRDFDLEEMLRGNFIDACAVVRRRLWSECGGFDPAAWGWEDWDLWLCAAERGWRFHRLPGVAFDYRVRPRSMLAEIEASPDCGARQRDHIVAKHRDLYTQHLPGLLRDIQCQEVAVREARLAIAAEREGWQQERARISLQLGSLDARLRFIEGTRVWRLRELLRRCKRWIAALARSQSFPR